MRVKVKDIAKAAGVSTTAVSLVLNGKPSRLSDATKEKITRVARELAFQQDSLHSESGERVKTMGLVVPSVSDPPYLNLLSRVQSCADGVGYTVFACVSEEDSERTCRAVESLATKNVDGILLVAPVTVEHDDRLTKMLKTLVSGAVPLVLVDRAVYSVFGDFVTTDNKYGGRTAALYLAEQGHGRIGYLGGPQNVYTARKRFQGYREGLAGRKLPYNDALAFFGDFSRESGREGAAALYEKGCRAVFAANGLMTDGAVEFARERGLRIPEDFAIVGYDAPGAQVPCICQNVSLMAEKSVDLLMEQIEAHGAKVPPRNFYITPVLSNGEGLPGF